MARKTKTQASEILALFERLVTWSSGDQRAPHKPLLVLYALGRWEQGQASNPYAEVSDALTSLLKEFGPPRKVHHPNQPFWRLQNDGVWEVVSDSLLTMSADGSPTKTSLLNCNARGAFTVEIENALRATPTLVGAISQLLLDAHFPASIHEDIIESVGLKSFDARAAGGRRDPDFRRRVLISYQHRCAMCGLQLLLSGHPIALEAAHIKWHQAAGPAVVQNGVCLCSLHHKLFDLGAFTIDTDYLILVSDEASGTCGPIDSLFSLHGKLVSKPIQLDDIPSQRFLAWHRREVFRGQPRPL